MTTQPDIDDAAEKALLARIEAAENLAPTVGSRGTVPVTVGGITYPGGINAVPLDDLAVLSGEDHAAMNEGHRSHRSRRLRQAAREGKLSPAIVKALQAKKVLSDPV